MVQTYPRWLDVSVSESALVHVRKGKGDLGDDMAESVDLKHPLRLLLLDVNEVTRQSVSVEDEAPMRCCCERAHQLGLSMMWLIGKGVREMM